MSVSKSTRAFRTISEAGDELDLQPHVLRFWESKFPQIQPMKRSGGRRFYRAEDIEFLRGIKILLHREKHPIKDVQKLIRIKGAQSIVDLGRSKEIAANPKTVKETNLVPDRIKPVIQPVIVSSTPEPVAALAKVHDDEVVRRLVPIDGGRRVRKQAASAAAAPIPASAPEAVPEPEIVHAEPAVDREDLQTALERLRGLKTRWDKFK